MKMVTKQPIEKNAIRILLVATVKGDGTSIPHRRMNRQRQSWMWRLFGRKRHETIKLASMCEVKGREDPCRGAALFIAESIL
jgi:hypothetical protein